MKQLKKLNKKFLEEIDVNQRPQIKRGWTAVSDSPQGIFFLSDENTYSVTTDKEEAVVFSDYENAVACLEHFLENVFIETEREQDIVHFFRIEKIEKVWERRKTFPLIMRW